LESGGFIMWVLLVLVLHSKLSFLWNLYFDWEHLT
jgi:hypothetical protein